MSKDYIVVIKEILTYHIRIKAENPREAIAKVDGGSNGEYVKFDMDSYSEKAYLEK